MEKVKSEKTSQEGVTVYFKNPGKGNTEDVLAIAKERALQLGIKTIVVASTTGWAAVKAVQALIGFRVIVVTYSAGFKEPNTQEFTEVGKGK